MKLTHRISPATAIEITAETQSEAFKELASAVEVFGQVSTCGKCGGSAIPRVRVVDGNAFHEAACTDLGCRAVLAFGSHKKNGSLFPKRKDADGRFLPDGGWTVYRPEKKDGDGKPF